MLTINNLLLFIKSLTVYLGFPVTSGHPFKPIKPGEEEP